VSCKTDRERLIELIKQGNIDYLWSTGKAHYTFLADYLLANGVIVPVRCKDCEYYTPIKQASIKWKSKTFYCTRNVNMKTNENDYCSCAKLNEREGK
jgi:hypothetical protein